jgi:hypothetical protein
MKFCSDNVFVLKISFGTSRIEMDTKLTAAKWPFVAPKKAIRLFFICRLKLTKSIPGAIPRAKSFLEYTKNPISPDVPEPCKT